MDEEQADCMSQAVAERGGAKSRIVIVGAGPTGLTLAALLRLRGFEPIVLEREMGISKLPQAHVVNPRTLEILEEVGAAELCVQAAGLSRLTGPVRWMESVAGRSYGSLEFVDGADKAGLSRYGFLNLAQNLLEPIIHDRFQALGGVVRFGEQVVGLVESGPEITLTVRSPDGAITSMSCDWLIGCDGAASTVRRSLGIAMNGPPSLARFITIYFRASFDHLVDGEPGALYWIGGSEVRGVIISFDQGVNHALLVPIADAPIEAFSDETALGFVRKALGDPAIEIELAGISSWNMSAQVAERFGCGRVWLAGDACHRFPPTGGLGLNSGVQDAHNLAWKLAAVIRGIASPSLLQTYEQERRPIALANTNQSVSNLMKMVEIDDALGIPMLAPVAPEAGQGGISCFPPEKLGIDPEQSGSAAKRALVQAAVESQRGHFGDSVGVHLGFSYDAGAFIPDGTPPPSLAPDHYAPDARPGARLPWFEWIDELGTKRSSLELLDRDRGTLLTYNLAWRAQTARLVTVRILPSGNEGVDRLLGVGPQGAVLVRPDGHVGWRTRNAGDDQEFANAIVSIFHTQSAKEVVPC